jgi:hypothetical protein
MNMISLASVIAAALAVSAAVISSSEALAQQSDRWRDKSERVVLHCSSDEYDTRTCIIPGPGRAVDVRVLRRTSSADCDRGKDWDVRDDRLWVRNGCRADFEILLVRGEWRDGDLAGGPGYGRDGDWRGRDHDRGRWEKPDFQTVQGACSRAAIDEAWRRGFYSAQYHNGPRLVEGVRGYEMRGQVRLHDRRGFTYWESVCEWDRGRVGLFSYQR